MHYTYMPERIFYGGIDPLSDESGRSLGVSALAYIDDVRS